LAQKHTISFLDKGKVRRFETTKEIADAAKSLTKEQMGLVGHILSVPTRVLRLGATGLNPAFAMANVAKDTVSAFINTQHPLRASAANLPVLAKATKAALNHGSKEYAELVREGAGGTSFDIARDAPRQNLKLIRAEKTRTSKVMYNVTHPAALFRAVEDTIGRSEEFNRAMQYYGNKDAALKAGKSLEDAKIYGANAARNDTVNFARAGDYGRVLNSALPYLNAGIQGSRTFLRTVKDHPVQTAAKLAATVFVPTATITAWNMSSQERKDAYDDIPDYEKQGNLIILPPHPVKDPKTGQWNAIKIPVSQEIANLNNIVRGGVEYSFKDGKMKPQDVVGDLIGTATSLNAQSPRQVIGQLTPQGIKPAIETLTNQNLYTGNKIVPDSKKNLQPEDQYGDYTSGTAKVIGKVAKVSPYEVDNFIKTSGGGVSQNIINLTDRGLSAAGVTSPDDIHGKSIPDSVKGRFSGAQGKSPYDIADEHTKTFSSQLQKLPGYKSMTPEDKAKALNRLQADVNKVYLPPAPGKSQSMLSARQIALNQGKPDLESYLTAQKSGGSSGSGGTASLSADEQTSFENSNKKLMTKGDTTFYKKKDGTVVKTATSTYQNKNQQSKLDLTLSTSKANDDHETWQKAALDKYNLLQKEADQYDPETEASDYNAKIKAAASLLDEIRKYNSYGGQFTKPKTGGKAASLKKSYTPFSIGGSSTSYATRNHSLKALLNAARMA
jgi:hypothetical protein